MNLGANFDVVDDVLERAEKGGLVSGAPVRLIFRDRIGPLVEWQVARGRYRRELDSVQVATKFGAITQALTNLTISGTDFSATAGLFPLARRESSIGDDLWDLWLLRLQAAAEAIGFAKKFAQGIVGAVGELVSNVYEHSCKAESGIVAFRTSTHGLELVVSDEGIGVLESLRRAPSFATLRDSGEALIAAASDGVSSLAPDSRRGFGVGQLFRALVGHGGEIRFRSGDHAVTIRGDTLSLAGRLTRARRPLIDGLTISVLCQPPSIRLR